MAKRAKAGKGKAKAKKVKDLDPKNRGKNVKGGDSITQRVVGRDAMRPVGRVLGGVRINIEP